MIDSTEKAGDAAEKTLIKAGRWQSINAWIGRQSLPRLLGLILGNTRDLERQLDEAKQEIVRLREERVVLREEHTAEREALWEEMVAREQRRIDENDALIGRLDALQDSLLMGKGMLPTTPAMRAAVTGQKTHVAGESVTSPKRMELDADVDRLIEMEERGDWRALDERIADLTETGTPHSKRVLRLYAARTKALEIKAQEDDLGLEVVVGPPVAHGEGRTM